MDGANLGMKALRDSQLATKSYFSLWKQGKPHERAIMAQRLSPWKVLFKMHTAKTNREEVGRWVRDRNQCPE